MRILICLQVLFLLMLGKFDSEAQNISIQGISPVHAVNITKKPLAINKLHLPSAMPVTPLPVVTNQVMSSNPILPTRLCLQRTTYCFIDWKWHLQLWW
jgi:hypothetical protein